MSIESPRRLGTYLPRTARQTVSGVASSKPSGPQIHVQKRDRNEERDLRHASGARIENRLEHHVSEELEHDERSRDVERRRPAGEGRQADEDRRPRGDPGADVRDETKRGGHDRPQQRIRHAEQPE